MEAILLCIIGFLLVFIGWQQHMHHRWVQSHWRPSFISPPKPLPPPVLPRKTPLNDLLPSNSTPFPLVRRVNAGWGTLMDLAPTRQFKKVKTFPILDVSSHYKDPVQVSWRE